MRHFNELSTFTIPKLKYFQPLKLYLANEETFYSKGIKLNFCNSLLHKFCITQIPYSWDITRNLWMTEGVSCEAKKIIKGV